MSILRVRAFFRMADFWSWEPVWDEKDFLVFIVWEDWRLVELFRNLDAEWLLMWVGLSSRGDFRGEGKRLEVER